MICHLRVEVAQCKMIGLLNWPIRKTQYYYNLRNKFFYAKMVMFGCCEVLNHELFWKSQIGHAYLEVTNFNIYFIRANGSRYLYFHAYRIFYHSGLIASYWRALSLVHSATLVKSNLRDPYG